MIKFKFLIFVLFVVFVFVFLVCDNDDEMFGIQEGIVNMMFEYIVDGVVFDIIQVYEINGIFVQFIIVNFYVGGIELMLEEGDVIFVEGKYLLVMLEVGMQEVIIVFVGYYYMVNFFVGVDFVINSQIEDDFIFCDVEDLFVIQFLVMYWNWNFGYCFLCIDGKVDIDGDGMMDEIMVFYLGINNMLQNVSFIVYKDVEIGSNMLYMEFDLVKLFEGVDLFIGYVIYIMNNFELVVVVWDNILVVISMKY